MQAQSQAQGVQIFTNASPTYIAVAYTLSISQLNSLQSVSNIISSIIIDMLYYIIDTLRVMEEEKNKTHPKAVREIIEKEIRTGRGQAT